MVSFLTVNYKSDFFAKALISSIPLKWKKENEIIIIDNSGDLRLNLPYVTIVKGGSCSSHSAGLDQGVKICSSKTIIISDIDCVILDPSILFKVTEFIEGGGSMIQCQGSSFKPYHPCFGALNKEIFLSEKLSFCSKELVSTPLDWTGFYGDPHPEGASSDLLKDYKGLVYLDVGVHAAYHLLRNNFRVLRIPKSNTPKEFLNLYKNKGINGWWFGFDKPQIWHVVYGASLERFLRSKNDKSVWHQKKKATQWVLENFVKHETQ